MPFYKHRCECGEEKETFVSVRSSKDVVTCDCGKSMKKVVTKAHVRNANSGDRNG